jgi:UDP-N-acetyl-D-mannosaminuronic acid dehydrogenase
MNIYDLKRAALRAPICVVGLGYVGLTNAILIANVGYEVIGLDVDPKRVGKINSYGWPLDPDEPTLPLLMRGQIVEQRLKATISYDEAVAACRVFIVAVPTPVYDNNHPNLDWLTAAVEGITIRAMDQKVVIIASTVPPGTTEAFASKDDQNLYAHAPERLSPGQLNKKAQAMVRIVGGATSDATELVSDLYREWFPYCDVVSATAMEAEITKTAENAYRDLKIAFAHELLWLCGEYDASFWRVRNMINTSPGRDVPYAGAGVGGHCLPKDGHLLFHGHHDRGGYLISEARRTNEMQPVYVAYHIHRQLEEHTCLGEDYKVLLCGVGYKANTTDARNSPALKIADLLRESGCDVELEDPYIEDLKTEGAWWHAAKDCDAIVFLQAHKAYKRIPWGLLREKMRTHIALDMVGNMESPPDDWIFWQIGQPHG